MKSANGDRITISGSVKLNAIRFASQRGFMWESGAALEDSESRQSIEYLKNTL
jgi:hypothetical protein